MTRPNSLLLPGPDAHSLARWYETGGQPDSPPLAAYQDPGGVWTVGYGHTGREVHSGYKIMLTDATSLLVDDLGAAGDSVTVLVRVPLTRNQYDALVDFTFNLGHVNLANSTLLRLVNQGGMVDAEGEFRKWIYGTVNGEKVKLPGLVKRRESEAGLWAGRGVILL